MARQVAPLFDALKQHADPKLWCRLEQLGIANPYALNGAAMSLAAPGGGDPATKKHRDAARAVLVPFLDALRAGELELLGFDARLPVSAGRVHVPAEMIDPADLDFAHSLLSGEGYEVVRLVVKEPETRTTTPDRRSRRKRLRSFIARERDSGVRHTKDTLRDAACQAIPGLTNDDFNAGWVEEAPSDWKKPGRPRKKTPA